MTTVCDGWVLSEQRAHGRVVLKDDGRDDGHVSHGMCAACQEQVMPSEANRLALEYAAYRANPTLDPRD